MENSNQIIKKKFLKDESTKSRQRIMGIVFFAIGVFIFFVLSQTTAPEAETIFVMTPGGSTVITPDLKFNSLLVINILAIICSGLGIFQFFKGFGKYTNLVLVFVGLMLTVSFLAWGARDGSINVGGMLRIMIMRSIPIVQATGCPVVFDATHSVQLPGGAGSSSGGQRQYAPILARAAVAAGADGVFLEVHPDPDHALCDGPNSLVLKRIPILLSQLRQLRQVVDPGDSGP